MKTTTWVWIILGLIVLAISVWYIHNLTKPLVEDEEEASKGGEDVAKDKEKNKILNKAVEYALSKGIIKPVAFPVPYRITSGFGWRIRPTTGRKQFHNGLDIAAPYGTPVHAPMDGVIKVKSKDPKCYKIKDKQGRVKKLKNAGGKQLLLIAGRLMFGFAHLNDFTVQSGQKVQKGQIIAHTGNTGCGTGPHLHFTVRYFTGTKWVLIDPKRFYEEIEKRKEKPV